MPRSGWAIVLLTLGGWACGSTPGNPTGSSTTSSSTPTTIPQTTITTTSSTGGGTGFTVSGTVTDGTSGGVLPNIVIRITDGVNANKTATTGTAGTYAIPVVTPGTMTLSAAATGYVTQAKGVVVSADTRVDWVMARVPSTTTTVTTTSSSTTTSIATTSASYAGGNILDLRGIRLRHCDPLLLVAGRGSYCTLEAQVFSREAVAGPLIGKAGMPQGCGSGVTTGGQVVKGGHSLPGPPPNVCPRPAGWPVNCYTRVFASIKGGAAMKPDTSERVSQVPSALEYQELARSNAELLAFAHTVAHDLREPLRTISAFTQRRFLESYNCG